jgi:hypothetical protein
VGLWLKEEREIGSKKEKVFKCNKLHSLEFSLEVDFSSHPFSFITNLHTLQYKVQI